MIALGISSCKKETASIEMKFHPDALAYVQLPVNKYFIYKDSASGAQDSVVVTQSNIEKVFVPKHESLSLFDPTIPAHFTQKFTLLLKKGGASGSDWFYGEAFLEPAVLILSPVFTDTGSLYFREKDRLNNVDKGYVFKYPLNSLTGSYSVITGSASTLPSITIEGKTYLEAIVYIDQNGLPSTNNNFRKSTYYWVKGIGIIKREIRTSNSIKTETLVRNG
jgi:hypothetical protein